MAKIKHISAREVLNAIGDPTIETTVVLSDNSIGVGSCAVGNSNGGSYQAYTLYDHDDTRYQGLGMLKAAQLVEEVIAPKLINMEATKQQVIDRTMIEMDGTQNKGRFGANTILSVSKAVAKAAAMSSVLPLFMYLREFVSVKNTPVHIPTPLISLMNGGLDGSATFDFQDFLFLPATSMAYSQALEAGVKVYNNLKKLLRSNNLSTLVSVEGGFSPQLPTNADALNFIGQAIASANFHLGFDVFLGIDAAASTFYKGQQYKIKDLESTVSTKKFVDFYAGLIKQYSILYTEDPLSEDDWDGWEEMTKRLATETIITGDALTATNLYRLQMAIDKRAITGIVIKPTQIGTVIESLAVVEVARAAGLKVIISERSAETNDDFMADFAVAVGADYVKCGAPTRGEHVAKYNRLLQIEQQLKML